MELIDKLQFYADNNRNVILESKHGVGKTARICQVFDKTFKVWEYFSGSTMDPFLHFIGIPTERTDDDGIKYLDFIRPRKFANESIEAIFVDEYNRTRKHVRNALMELIQFKSINGKKFPKLRVVWAAINPQDDEKYDVEPIDPAQISRFHVNISLPYLPDPQYFTEKFPAYAKPALEWWHALPEKEKDNVCPRTLDYALELYQINGDLRDCLKLSTNVDKLTKALGGGAIVDKLIGFMKAQDVSGAKAFLSNQNNYDGAISFILGDNNRMHFFLPLCPKDCISQLMSKYQDVRTHCFKYALSIPVYKDILIEVNKSGLNPTMTRAIAAHAKTNPTFAALFTLSNKYISNKPQNLGAATHKGYSKPETLDGIDTLMLHPEKMLEKLRHTIPTNRLVEGETGFDTQQMRAIESLSVLNKMVKSHHPIKLHKPFEHEISAVNSVIQMTGLGMEELQKRIDVSDLFKYLDSSAVADKVYRA